MITCTLGKRKYSVDFVSGRALREIGPAMDMYQRLSRAAASAAAGEEVTDATGTADAMDVLVTWFCLLFQNQFKPDAVYDLYPVDRLMRDVTFALLAVQSSATQVLSDFPTKPTPEEKPDGEKKAKG